jgi:hypothetical protein
MKKALIFGPIFGLVFGLIEMVTLSFSLDFLYGFTGFFSFAAYLGLLIWIMYSEAQQGKPYGRRFLAGLVFSVMIGVVYGLLAGLAGFIFAEQVAELERGGIEAFEELGWGGDFLDQAEQDIEPTPVLNLIGEFFGAIIFNLFFGSALSAIVASFFGAKDDQKGDKKNAEKETKDEE